jgi:hypothetical protein
LIVFFWVWQKAKGSVQNQEWGNTYKNPWIASVLRSFLDLLTYRTNICFRQKINKYSAGRKFQDIIWPICRNGQKIRTLAAEMSINSAAEMRNSVFKRWPTGRPHLAVACQPRAAAPDSRCAAQLSRPGPKPLGPIARNKLLRLLP